MPDFLNQPHPFTTKGINLRYPVDQQPAGAMPYLMNLRCLVESTLQPRNGTVEVGDMGSGEPVTALRRLNNLIAGNYTRLMVSGGALYSGTTAFTSRDTGYAGNSAMVPFRPDDSPEPWMYVADPAKMRKIRTDGLNYLMGITPPTAPPSTGFGVPSYNIIESFESVGSWSASGTAGSISTPIRINTVIAHILYDSGSTGWATVNPNQADGNLQPGMLILFGATEWVKVHDVFQPITNSTVAAISYDVGTTGLCCIQLAGPSSGLVPNCMVQVGSEQVRVRSVTLSASGIPSFRCNASGTHAAGDTVLGLVSFRAYTAATWATSTTLVKTSFQSTVAAGLGILSAPIALNLNVLNPGGLPMTPDDYLHISLLVDNPNNVVAGRVYLDIDATTNDFQHNAYYYEFRPSDFQSSVSGAVTALTAGQLAIQRQIITQSVGNDFGQFVSDGSGGLGAGETFSINTFVYDAGQGLYVAGDGTSTTSVQQIPGNSQWTELVINISDLLNGRIGSDQSRSLANVEVISVQLNVTDTTVLLVDSWWVGGGYGQDVGATGSPALHAYRYKSSLTGAVSNNSPVVRSGLNPMRERIVVNVAASTDPQVDKIEVFHFGAGLDEWRLVAVAPNATGQVNDDIDALTTTVNITLPFDDFLPFPTSDVPRLGTCNVTGTTIDWVSGDKFNLKWAPGSSVIINGVTCTLYGSPISTTKLFLVESAGNGSAQSFLIPEATIQGNPLASLWGPFGGTDMGNVMFAVGDVNQPGNLYWTKASSPDTASDLAWLEVTSPSEPLLNGFTYDSKAFVFSSERLFAIFSTTNADGSVGFTTQEVPNGKGLIARDASCVGPRFWWVSKSGIWESSGGEPTSITNDDLYPLFPHEGAQPVQPINGIYPPDFSQPDSMRLSYADSSLYFLYTDIQGNPGCFRYDINRTGWFPYSYTPTLSIAYQEEGEGVDSVLLGSTTGLISQISHTPSDNGAAISCKAQTPSDSLTDNRLQKLYGDLYLDLDPNSAEITITPGLNEFTQATAPATVGGDGRQHVVADFLDGDGVLGRNIGLTYEWSSASAVPILYGWSYSYVPKVSDTLQRGTDYDNAGVNGWKFVQGMRLTADTNGLPVILQIQGDSGVVGVLSVPATHNGQVTIPYSWPAFFAHNLRIVPNGANPIRIYNVEWIFEPAPDLATIWQTQGTTHDLPGFHHHRDAYIAVYAPTGGTITLTIAGSQATTTYPVAVTAGLHQRIYLPLAGNKSLITSYLLTADFPFGVYKKDCEMRVKAWGDPGAYQVKNPFGDISRASGATI